MNTSTHSLTLSAPKQRTFDFLSRIDNLPKWATLVCRELKREPGGKHKVVTPQGEIFFRIVADPATGVIDMYGGPSEAVMAHRPTRVIGLDNLSSLFLFTALQYPGVSDEDFAAQCRGLEAELPHIKAQVEAGPVSREILL